MPGRVCFECEHWWSLCRCLCCGRTANGCESMFPPSHILFHVVRVEDGEIGPQSSGGEGKRCKRNGQGNLKQTTGDNTAQSEPTGRAALAILKPEFAPLELTPGGLRQDSLQPTNHRLRNSLPACIRRHMHYRCMLPSDLLLAVFLLIQSSSAEVAYLQHRAKWKKS